MIKRFNEYIKESIEIEDEIFNDEVWEEEEYSEFRNVDYGYRFKKGDRVKLKTDSRFRGPVGNRVGIIKNKQGNTFSGGDWWVVKWEERDNALNMSNYPTQDLLIYHADYE